MGNQRRGGAIEYLPGVTEDSLKKYELDITRPPNIVVALMADAYNEPELRAWYCVNECPLGKDCREIPEMPAERALIRLQNSVYEMEQLTRQLSLLMEDDRVEEGEQTLITKDGGSLYITTCVINVCLLLAGVTVFTMFMESPFRGYTNISICFPLTACQWEKL